LKAYSMWLSGNGLDEELLKFVFNPRRSSVAEDLHPFRLESDRDLLQSRCRCASACSGDKALVSGVRVVSASHRRRARERGVVGGETGAAIAGASRPSGNLFRAETPSEVAKAAFVPRRDVVLRGLAEIQHEVREVRLR